MANLARFILDAAACVYRCTTGARNPLFSNRGAPLGFSFRSPSAAARGRLISHVTVWWQPAAGIRRGGSDMTSGTPNPALIEIDNVSKSFDGGATFAVRDASIALDTGAFMAVVGTSGSGKTTTLKFINRLVEPDSGEVRIEGVRVGTIDALTPPRTLGEAFQSIGLSPHMRLRESI